MKSKSTATYKEKQYSCCNLNHNTKETNISPLSQVSKHKDDEGSKCDCKCGH